MFSNIDFKKINKYLSKYKIIVISIVCLVVFLLLTYLKRVKEHFNNDNLIVIDTTSNFDFENTYNNTKPYILYSLIPNSYEFNKEISITNSNGNNRTLMDNTVQLHALICNNNYLNKDHKQTILSYTLDVDKKIHFFIKDSKLYLDIKGIRCSDLKLGFDNGLITRTDTFTLNYSTIRGLINNKWYFVSLYMDLTEDITADNIENKIKLFINRGTNCSLQVATNPSPSYANETTDINNTNINSLTIGSINDIKHILYHYEPLDGTNNRVPTRLISPKGQLVFGNVNRNTVGFKLLKSSLTSLGSNITFIQRERALNFAANHGGLTEDSVRAAINTALTIVNGAINNGFTIEMKIKFAAGGDTESTQDLIDFSNDTGSLLNVQLIKSSNSIKFKFIRSANSNAEFEVSNSDVTSFNYSEFHKLNVVCKKYH